MRLIQKDVAEVRASLEYSQVKCEEKQSQLQGIEIRLKEDDSNESKEEKPDGILFYNDYSANTLARRQAQIPMLQKMRKQGKLAYLIKDRLIVKDKPPDWKFAATNARPDDADDADDDGEVSVNLP
eukprot:gene9976-18598_t